MSTTADDGRRSAGADEDEAMGLGPALEVLRRSPAVPPGAVDRVMAAAVARGHRPVVGAPVRRVSWAAAAWRVAAALVLVAGVGAAAWRSRRAPDLADAVAVRAPIAAAPVAMVPAGDVLAAANAGGADAPLPASFVLRRPVAAHVALVGDFNGWDPAATPMARAGDGTWTATLAVPPGRHAYAFVVDGAWVTDPRVPATHDADYGRDHSIVVVGTP
jgi:hypothetical protein